MPEKAQVVVVTGASSGIGLATARMLAADGVHVVMVSRNPRRAEAARKAVVAIPGNASVTTELADFARMDEVERCGDRILGQFPRIDGLVNNAGILVARRRITPDGFETTMAVNHLAPFLLSHKLLPALSAAGGRVVNVSSDGHSAGDLRRAPIEDILRGHVWAGMIRAYGDSKLANILFTREWMIRHAASGTVANALHPGALRTRVWNRNLHPLSIFMQPFKFFLGPASRGAAAVVELLTAGLADQGGAYLYKGRPGRESEQAQDAELASRLWDTSQQLVLADR